MKKIEGGYTTWARKSIYSELFHKPDKWFKIWFYIVNAVSHTTDEKEQRIRGQGYFTYEIIAMATGASFSQIKHCVEFLKKGKHITTQKKPRSFNIIVNNYDFYQNWKNYIDEEKGRQKEDRRKTEGKQEDAPYKKALKELKTLENKEIGKPIPCAVKDFDLFWAEYPKKVGKIKANEAFKKIKGKTTIDKIIEAVRKQKKSIKWNQNNGQYIPNPTTWLNSGGWDDELTYETTGWPGI